MATTLATQIIGTDWVDLTVNLPAISGKTVRIENLFRSALVEIVFSSSASTPSGVSGEKLGYDGTTQGSALHVWARASAAGAELSIALLDASDQQIMRSPRDAAASSTPLAGSVSDTVAHSYGPFTPQLARDIWATLVGNAATGVAQLVRSTDGGVTKAGLTAGGDVWASWSFSGVTGSIVNEQIGTETDAAATYYLAVTLSTGSLTYRIAQ